MTRAGCRINYFVLVCFLIEYIYKKNEKNTVAITLSHCVCIFCLVLTIELIRWKMNSEKTEIIAVLKDIKNEDI